MKQKNDLKSRTLTQKIAIGLLVICLIAISAIIWSSSNIPIDEKIQTQLDITIPNNANELGYWQTSDNELIILAKFTIDQGDLEATMKSVRTRENQCISFERTPNYRPDFYEYESIEWWSPYDAQNYDGVSCDREDLGNGFTNTNVMVEYKDMSKATVYIESFIPRDGDHPYR